MSVLNVGQYRIDPLVIEPGATGVLKMKLERPYEKLRVWLRCGDAIGTAFSYTVSFYLGKVLLSTVSRTAVQSDVYDYVMTNDIEGYLSVEVVNSDTVAHMFEAVVVFR